MKYFQLLCKVIAGGFAYLIAGNPCLSSKRIILEHSEGIFLVSIMKLLYFGPIAEKGKPAIGGYEAANRKNIDELRRQGIEVVEFRNPTINRKWGALGKLAYFKLFLYPFALIKYCGKKDVILHITPLYRALAWPSVFTLWVAKILGIKRILDLRGGSFTHYYTVKGTAYKWMLKKMLNFATVVTVEGRRYIREIKDIIGYNGKMIYFPNLEECSNLVYKHREQEKYNLFYFGRITQNKGLDIIIDLINRLDDRFHLYLAGGIAADFDENEIRENPKITYLGILTRDEIKEQMPKMHFFIFPTRHIGEGQSNSLIEAMSEGLIPVVADQGFSAEVVADCGIVLPQNSDAEEYKKAVMSIAEKDLREQGEKCIKHINAHHNLKREIAKLVELYKTII